MEFFCSAWKFLVFDRDLAIHRRIGPFQWRFRVAGFGEVQELRDYSHLWVMFSRYNMKWGIAFSLFIALLGGIPWLIREDTRKFALNMAALFLSIQACWLIHHYFL